MFYDLRRPKSCQLGPSIKTRAQSVSSLLLPFRMTNVAIPWAVELSYLYNFGSAFRRRKHEACIRRHHIDSNKFCQPDVCAFGLWLVVSGKESVTKLPFYCFSLFTFQNMSGTLQRTAEPCPEINHDDIERIPCKQEAPLPENNGSEWVLNRSSGMSYGCHTSSFWVTQAAVLFKEIPLDRRFHVGLR